MWLRRVWNAQPESIADSTHLAVLARFISPARTPTPLRDPTRRPEMGQASPLRSQDFTTRSRLYSRLTMDEQEPVQVVELRISYRYATAHPWVIQAIGGFLSAYFMEHPGFRVQRCMEELESGTYLWICEVPPSMKVLRLLRRLKEDIPPCHAHQIVTEPPARSRYLIDCPE